MCISHWYVAGPGAAAGMTVSDWIQLGLIVVGACGVLVALLAPIRADRNQRLRDRDRAREIETVVNDAIVTLKGSCDSVLMFFAVDESSQSIPNLQIPRILEDRSLWVPHVSGDFLREVAMILERVDRFEACVRAFEESPPEHQGRREGSREAAEIRAQQILSMVESFLKRSSKKQFAEAMKKKSLFSRFR